MLCTIVYHYILAQDLLIFRLFETSSSGVRIYRVCGVVYSTMAYIPAGVDGGIYETIGITLITIVLREEKTASDGGHEALCFHMQSCTVRFDCFTCTMYTYMYILREAIMHTHTHTHTHTCHLIVSHSLDSRCWKITAYGWHSEYMVGVVRRSPTHNLGHLR